MAKDLRIRDEQGNLLYPVTVTDLVFNDQTGETLTEELEGKQDTISDLTTIRSGASAGSTAYQKPNGGIPKTDLASAVQTSLGKADTALQSHQDISGKQDVLVSGTNIKTVNNTSLLGSGNISIPKGDPGEDGENAYQPFKGWFDSSSALSSAYPTPQVGDFAYVKGATSTDPVAIYACSTAGTWADSGNTFNPANNQEFASGEALNTVHIVDGLESSLATDVLSAKQGNVLNQKVAALGLKCDHNTTNIENLQQEIDAITPITIEGDVTNAPDEEDITTDANDLLKLKDRSTAVNQKGYKILRKGVALSTQMSDANTIYEIRYPFDLNGDTLTIPSGCVLNFNGGKFSNGGLEGNNTGIIAPVVQIFDNVTPSGSWSVESAWAEWFGANTNNADNSSAINSALLFGRVTISDGIYNVEQSITLDGGKSLLLSDGCTLKKSSNPSAPMIRITNNNNYIGGNSKKSKLQSDVASPYGVISIGDYDTYISTSEVCYNKVENLSLYGTKDLTQSVAIYMRSQKVVGHYYNSMSNLLIRSFNVGISLAGDVNANFFRDITFYGVGTSSSAETHNDTDSAILLQSIYDGETLRSCMENMFSQLFHTMQNNSTASLYIKGRVIYNVFNQFLSEPGGSSRFMVVEGTAAKYNKIDYVGNTSVSSTIEDSAQFYADNQLNTTSRITTNNISANRLEIGGRISKLGYDRLSGNCCVFSGAKANISTSQAKTYQLLRVRHTRITGNVGSIIVVMTLQSSNSQASVNRVTLVMRKRSASLWEHTAFTDVYNNYFDIKTPIIGSSYANIYFSLKGTSATNVTLYYTIEVYASSTITEDDVTVYDTNEEYTGETTSLYYKPSGSTAERITTPIVGQQFFDTTKGVPMWWNGTNWVTSNNESADMSTSGTFANAPTPTNVGFQYFCTSGASIDGGATEKTNIVIYYTGSGWVDANGNAVAAKA